MKEAQFYTNQKLSIKCLLCNHFCQITDGQSGICHVRKNINSKLYSLVYAHPISMHVDPVEKKPIFHYLPGSFTFSLGTIGCNFKCANCQNWTISQPNNDKTFLFDNETIAPKIIIDEAIKNHCQSISYTYNEPTVFAEYALDIMKLAQKNGLKNIWVSNGYMSPDCLEHILPYLDAANIDLKSFDNDFYVNNCGAKLEPVLNNLKILKQNKIHLEITTLIIPSLSDDINMLINLSYFIANELGDDTPWHISRFFGDISWKLEKTSQTEILLLENIYKTGHKQGLKYVYVGNISASKLENTYCHNCHELSIERLGYNIRRFDNQGKCKNCQTNLNILI